MRSWDLIRPGTIPVKRRFLSMPSLPLASKALWVNVRGFFTQQRHNVRTSKILLAVVCSAACPVVAQLEDDPVILLDPLRVQGEYPETSQRLLPLDNDSGAFPAGVLDSPRSITVVTPEMLYLKGIESFDDLDAVGAGTQRVNFFGIAGTPFIRGIVAGTYYDGMQRAYQRNEMPTSFGSLEALDIVKGPAPAHLSTTLAGGYVNMVPKSPYFGEARGRVTLTAGRWDKYRGQLDYGGPTRFNGAPAAWRVSLTAQEAGSYYDNVRNDFVSLYAAAIVRTGRDSSLFMGGEYYRFQSGEVPGWNRPTQELVDSGRYVIGEPVDVADPDWGGAANRNLVSYPGGVGDINGIEDFNALVIPRGVVEEALATGTIDAAAVDALLDLRDPDDRARAYGQPLPSSGQRDPRFDASANSARDATLARLMTGGSSDGFRYTRDYFDAGGIVFTAPIEGSQILADPDDYANSQDFLWFANWKRKPRTGGMIQNQVYIERLETRKLSTYGFSLYSDQLILADKLTLQADFDSIASTLTYGAEARYSWAKMRQDFFAEPFSRRDLTRDTISPNSVVRAGPQEAPDGLNLWSPGLGANEESDLYLGGLFALLDTRLGERLRFFTGLRGETAHWDTRLPDEVERRTQAQIDATRSKGSTSYLNGSFGPTLTLVEGVNLYGAVQLGTALGPGDGGTISGRASFTDVRLYEAGIKASLLDDTLFTSLCIYEWKQSVFSELDARSFPLRGRGVEMEATYTRGALSLVGAFTAQRVTLETDVLGYGTLPFTERDWALNAGIMSATSDRDTPNNPDNVYAGFPELSASLMAVWQIGGGFGLAGGPEWRQAYWASHDRSLRLPASLIWNALLFYRSGPWNVSLRLENLTDEDYFLASDPVFSANTLVTKGQPFGWELGAAYAF